MEKQLTQYFTGNYLSNILKRFNSTKITLIEIVNSNGAGYTKIAFQDSRYVDIPLPLKMEEINNAIATSEIEVSDHILYCIIGNISPYEQGNTVSN